MGGGRKHYLIWDSDTIPLRDFVFFKQDKVIFEISPHIHRPYFETLENLIDTNQIRPKHSFILEHMMIQKSKMQELINHIESTHKKPFYEAILESIDPKQLAYSGFSEFETYGYFITLNYPDSFVLTKRKRDRFARQILGQNPSIESLEWYAKSYDVISLESWDRESILNKYVESRLFRLIPARIYRKILPFTNRILHIFYKYFTNKID